MPRRGICIFILAFVFGLGSTLAKPHAGVTYVKTEAAGVPLHLVDIDLERDDLVVRPVVVPNGHRVQFGSLAKQHRPVAAINGTFFDTKTNITVGNLVSRGRLLSEGMTGSNLVFESNGTVQLLSSSRNLGRYKDWSKVEFAVGGGPTLLSSGKYFMSPKSEGFRDPGLFRPRPRTAIGVTKDGHLRFVVVTQPVSLWQLARALKELRCYHAINLDGGSSTGLSVGGKVVVRPQRKLTNLVGVFAAHMEPKLSRAVYVAQARALAHYRKGTALFKKRAWRLARSQMRQAVSKDPEQAGYWKAAGEAELKLGNRLQGTKDLKMASTIYLERGNLTSALATAQKVVAVRPNDMGAHLICGECQVELGENKEADRHLRIVLESEPGHPKAMELLKVVKFRQRDKEEPAPLEFPDQNTSDRVTGPKATDHAYFSGLEVVLELMKGNN